MTKAHTPWLLPYTTKFHHNFQLQIFNNQSTKKSPRPDEIESNSNKVQFMTKALTPWVLPCTANSTIIWLIFEFTDLQQSKCPSYAPQNWPLLRVPPLTYTPRAPMQFLAWHMATCLTVAMTPSSIVSHLFFDPVADPTWYCSPRRADSPCPFSWWRRYWPKCFVSWAPPPWEPGQPLPRHSAQVLQCHCWRQSWYPQWLVCYILFFFSIIPDIIPG